MEHSVGMEPQQGPPRAKGLRKKVAFAELPASSSRTCGVMQAKVCEGIGL